MNLSFLKGHKLAQITILLYGIIMVFLAFYASGTGDDGDSIFHYLYAKEAFKHPEHYVNHWAKPVYVAIMSPIAQLGFTAIKLFNIFLATLTMWLTYLSAKNLNIERAFLIPLIMALVPMNYYLVLSGLTEPLFAFWMMAGIYLFTKKKPLWAVLILSFLPFVRSEGLIILCLVAPYLLWIRKWYLIPFLMLGYLFYAFVGYPHYKDLAWVFNKMSYGTWSSGYGSGKLLHFVKKMPDITGYAISVLLLAGVIYGAVRLFKYWQNNKKHPFLKEEIWLVYGIFTAYFIGHTLFWYLGIFNSYGMMRVMLGVLPLIAIIVLRSINLTINTVPLQKLSVQYLAVIAGVIFIYSFFNKIKWENQFSLTWNQQLISKYAEKYKKKYKDHTIYTDAIYPAMVFDFDIFDPVRHRQTPQLFTGEPIPEKSVIIWDDHFSVIDMNVPRSEIDGDDRFKLISSPGFNEETQSKVALYEYIPSSNDPGLLKYIDYETEGDYKSRDTTYAYSGNYSLKVKPPYQYGNVFNGFLNSLQGDPGSKLRLSFWAYSPLIDEQNKEIKAVVSFESKEKSFDWHGAPILLSEAGKWQYFEVERPILPYKLYKSDRVKAYIFNPTGMDVYVDDVKVEWIK